MVFLINRHPFLALLVLSALPLLSVQAKGKKLKFCKLDNVLECLAEPLAFFTSQENSTGLPSNNFEYEQYCFNNHDYMPYCAGKWLERCGSGTHLYIAKRFWFQPFQESMRLYCDSKGSIRPNTLKHAHCMIHQVKLSSVYRRECVRPLQANNEYIISKMKEQPRSKGSAFFRGVCCAYNQWENCIVGLIERTCGLEAAKMIPHFIRHLTMNLFSGFCQQGAFQSTSETQCPPGLFVAPSESPPTGYGSKSYLSHIFSYMCPNVGWGVLPHRDY